MIERDRMIAEAMRSGLSREEVSILTDVSKHAFEQGMSTVTQADTCPPDLRVAAFASVLASFATILREKLPEHWAAVVATETSTGETSFKPSRKAGKFEP